MHYKGIRLKYLASENDGISDWYVNNIVRLLQEIGFGVNVQMVPRAILEN